MSAPPRVVLDTNVWLDLLHFHDPRCPALRQAVHARIVQPVADTATRTELERVLGYPALRLESPARAALLQRHDALAEHVATEGPPTPLPRCADPDDQMFLELAARAGARWLVSRDAALLALAARLRTAGPFDIVTPWDWAAPDLA